MAIIEVNHVTKEYKLGQLTSLKHTALDDIAIGAALATKTENWCLITHATSLTARSPEDEPHN